MRLAQAWVITAKDFAVFRKKRSILTSIVGFELLVGVLLPIVIRSVAGKSPHPATVLPPLINAFSFMFVTGAALLPVSIASYSLVGEKVQKSLEPLLAAPVTDAEILAGKALAAFLPAMAATYAGAVVFMVLVDAVTYGILQRLYYPNGAMGVILLLLAPLASAFSVEANVLISARATDVRTAQQLGALPLVLFGAIYLLAELRIVSLSVSTLLLLAAALLVIDLGAVYAVVQTFRREEILTRWR
jgi:ABC-type Na+ efflux pump permease subunit